jgi:hypothetical protein
MATKEVFSYDKVKGITIGEVINVGYDKHNDTIIVVEDRGLTIGSVHHTFGSKAEGLIELIDALQTYGQKKFDERKEIFDKIREVIKT